MAAQNRRATVYLVLERSARRPRWCHDAEARIVRTSASAPRLVAGQCAVRVTVEVPDVAFEPVLDVPEALAFGVADVLPRERRESGRLMGYFYAFVAGFVIAWPIAVCHGIDLERRWWRR